MSALTQIADEGEKTALALSLHQAVSTNTAAQCDCGRTNKYGLTDAIRKQEKIEWLHVRHEEVAAFAAGAEARLTDSLAVCAGSCGPGNLHLINGRFDCHRSRGPVLAIAGHIPSPEIGSGYFQETHPENLFKECSHYCELVSNARQMPRTVEIAIREAVGKRRVSVIVLPGGLE